MLGQVHPTWLLPAGAADGASPQTEEAGEAAADAAPEDTETSGGAQTPEGEAP